VTYELKTPAWDWSVYNFFKHYKNSILKQVNGRWTHMRGLNAEHRLMVDIRNTFQSAEGAAADLKRLVLERGFSTMERIYGGGVRFMEWGANGAPQMSRLFTWAEIMA